MTNLKYLFYFMFVVDFVVLICNSQIEVTGQIIVLSFAFWNLFIAFLLNSFGDSV